MKLSELMRNQVRRIASKYAIAEDFDADFIKLAQSSPLLDPTNLAQHSTFCSTRYIVENGIEGDIVECGVAAGTQVVVMGLTLKALGVTDRPIYLYDTFAGMTAPTEHDAKYVPTLSNLDTSGTKDRWERDQRGGHNEWCYTPIETVRENVYSSGYPEEMFTFVKGNVLETIPNQFHERIAYLRLDTDFYDSTLHELEHLFALVSQHGVVTLDDYGAWAGCRRAADEYFGKSEEKPLLFRTSWKERSFLRTGTPPAQSGIQGDRTAAVGR